MAKKGQITTFIILGMVILIAFAFVLYARNIQSKSQIENTKTFETEFSAINEYVTSCLKDVGYESLRITGLGGGYTYVPIILEIKNTSYWYYNVVNLQPFLPVIEQRLNDYINSNLTKCTNFDVFTNQGFVIKYDQPTTITAIAEDDVSIKVTYPIEVKKKNATKELSEFIMSYKLYFK